MSPPNRRYHVMRPLIALTAIILAAAGCFIVDTQTGELWSYRGDGKPATKIGEPLSK